MKFHSQCALIDRFSLKERIVMRIGWSGFMSVGAWTIYKQNPFWTWAYVAYGLLGFALVVLPSMCARCPYPYKRSTCLFVPPAILRKFYPYQGPNMTTAGKTAAFATMAGMVILPNFWLVNDIPLLMIFWLLGIPILAAFPMHYCSRCRHFRCPMNKVPK